MIFLKLKFKLLSLIAVIAVSVFLVSCEQDAIQDIQEPVAQNAEINIQTVKEERLALAKHLSVMIAEQQELNEVLKEMIDEEVEKGFYEKEIFFNIKKDETSRLLNGTTLNARLSSSHNDDISKTMDYLAINDPGLAVLMVNPSESTEFNTRVYVDNGIDDQDPNSMIEYFENGVKGTHPISEVPTTMTYIVRQSEAYLSPVEVEQMNPNSLTNLGSVEGKEIYAFGYNTAKFGTSAKELSENNNLKLGTGNCPRDNFAGKERLLNFKTTKYDDLFDNESEYRFDILFADNGTSIGTLRAEYSGTRPNIWNFAGKDIITWDSENDHDRMKYVITERDIGYTTKVKIGLPGTGASVELSYTNGDDWIGETIVEYCDQINNTGGGEYTVGGTFTFSVGQGDGTPGINPDPHPNPGGNVTTKYDVRFKSTDNLYLCSENGNAYAIANRNAVGAWEKFTLEIAADGSIAIKGSNGKYADVDRSNQSRIKFNSNDSNCSDCRFKLVDAGGGYKAIKSLATNQYVASEGTYNQPVRANRNSINHWEKWTVYGL